MANLVVRVVVLLIIIVFLLFLLKPKVSVWMNNRGHDVFSQGDYPKALEYFKTALRLTPGYIEAHFNLATLYESMKNEDAAILEYEQVVGFDKKYFQAYRALVEIYIGRSKFEKAFQLAEEADHRIQSAASAALLRNVSQRYAAESARQGAEALSDRREVVGAGLLDKAIALDPQQVLSYYAYAIHYFKKGDHLRTEKYARMVIAVDPKNWTAYQLLGDVAFGKQEFAAAAGYYKQVLNLSQGGAEVYNKIGLSFMNLERLEQARRYLSKAVALQPENILFRYNLASVCRDGQYFDEAVRFYQQILALQPDYPNVHNDLADIYLFQGKVGLAAEESAAEIASSSRLLEKNPGDIDVLNNLAYAYVRSGDAGKGRAIIESVIATAPEFRQAYLTLGAACKKLADFTCAEDAFNKARRLSKETNFIDRELKNLYEGSGKIESITE